MRELYIKKKFFLFLIHLHYIILLNNKIFLHLKQIKMYNEKNPIEKLLHWEILTAIESYEFLLRVLFTSIANN